MKKEEIEVLRKNLKRFRGSINEIAEKTGFTRQFIRKVLVGERNSMDVLEAAASVLEKNQAKFHERQNAIRASLQRAMSYQ